MESFQGGNTEFVGAAEENSERIVRLGGVESVCRSLNSKYMPAETIGTAPSYNEHLLTPHKLGKFEMPPQNLKTYR